MDIDIDYQLLGSLSLFNADKFTAVFVVYDHIWIFNFFVINFFKVNSLQIVISFVDGRHKGDKEFQLLLETCLIGTWLYSLDLW